MHGFRLSRLNPQPRSYEPKLEPDEQLERAIRYAYGDEAVEQALEPTAPTQVRRGRRRPIAQGKLASTMDAGRAFKVSAVVAANVDFPALEGADAHRLWTILSLCTDAVTRIQLLDLEAVCGRPFRDLDAFRRLIEGSIAYCPFLPDLQGVQLVENIVLEEGERNRAFVRGKSSEIEVTLNQRAMWALKSKPTAEINATAWRHVTGRLAVRLLVMAAGGTRLQSTDALSLTLDEADIDLYAPNLGRRTMAQFVGVYVRTAIDTLKTLEPQEFEWGYWPIRKGAATTGVTIYASSSRWKGRKRPATVAAAQNKAQRSADAAWRKQRQERLAKERAERIAARKTAS